MFLRSFLKHPEAILESVRMPCALINSYQPIDACKKLLDEHCKEYVRKYITESSFYIN